MQELFKYLPVFLLAFAASFLLTPLVRWFAFKKGFISYPRSDRWHKYPTALLGGVGIYAASVIAIAVCIPFNRYIAGVLSGATFLFIVGLLDDTYKFSPYFKLLMQIIAGCIVISFGIVFGFSDNFLLTAPLTLLWIIGITNSFNLLDNVDGLAAGVAFIASFMLFLSSLLFYNNPMMVFSLIIAAASLGFLFYNFHPAKIFMGDSGSMFLGFSLALIAIGGTMRHVSHLLVTMLIPALILSVPIFDTLFVIISRKFSGRKIFTGGKDHASHRLISLGLSTRKSVLLLYAISIAVGLITMLYTKISISVISIIGFFVFVILLFLGVFLFNIEETSPANKVKARSKNNSRLILDNMLLHKKRILEVTLDFIFICLAYYLAYFLRFEGGLLKSNIFLVQESLVWVISIKLIIFFSCGLYRGVWKYIGLSDFLTIFKVISLSSLAVVLFITFVFRFKDYSRAVFFIDWMLLLLFTAGSRFLFRIIGEFLSRLSDSGENILIFGAGDAGEMVLREIKRNKKLNYRAVGFIDDDASKTGNKIHGIVVLGTRNKLKSVLKEKDIRHVIIAMPSADFSDIDEIFDICRAHGIGCRSIKGILDKEVISN